MSNSIFSVFLCGFSVFFLHSNNLSSDWPVLLMAFVSWFFVHKSASGSFCVHSKSGGALLATPFSSTSSCSAICLTSFSDGDLDSIDCFLSVMLNGIAFSELSKIFDESVDVFEIFTSIKR